MLPSLKMSLSKSETIFSERERELTRHGVSEPAQHRWQRRLFSFCLLSGLRLTTIQKTPKIFITTGKALHLLESLMFSVKMIVRAELTGKRLSAQLCNQEKKKERN